MTCPCCGNVTPVESVKKQFKEGKTSEKILAVIYESNIGIIYLLHVLIIRLLKQL